MNLTIKDAIYHFAYYLIHDENYDIVYMSEQEDEVWIRKTENRTTRIIRLLNRQFDWKNHLKTDIAKVFQQAQSMGYYLKGNKISIYNIYTSPEGPIDSWEKLKKPLIVNNEKSIRMNVFYITEQNYKNEEERLIEMLKVPDAFKIMMEMPIKNSDGYSFYKNSLFDIFKRKHKKLRHHLKPKKAYGSALLILLIMIGGVMSSFGLALSNFIEINSLILNRMILIFEGMFMQNNLSYLFLTIISTFIFGKIIERVYGPLKLIFIFIISGILSNGLLLSIFPTYDLNSASAVFGILGAILYYGYENQRRIPYRLQRNFLLFLFTSLILSIVLLPDSSGVFVLGLIIGVSSAMAVGLPVKRSIFTQIIGITLLLAYTAMMVVF